jgi:hypothetical protein
MNQRITSPIQAAAKQTLTRPQRKRKTPEVLAPVLPIKLSKQITEKLQNRKEDLWAQVKALEAAQPFQSAFRLLENVRRKSTLPVQVSAPSG